MSPAKWAVGRPVSVLVLTLACAVLGAVRLPGIPLDLLPQMNLPTASVAVIYPGASPQAVEAEITQPLEQLLTGLPHLQTLSTYSLQNVGVAVLQFSWGTPIPEALASIRGQVDRLSVSLPKDAMAPLVLATDPSQLPVLQLAFTGKDLPALSELIRTRVLPVVSQVDGVAQASLDGATTPQIDVTYDQSKLRETGLTPDLLQQVLRAANIYVPAAPLQEGERLWQVRTGYSLHSLDDLANVVVGVKAPTVNPLMPFLASVPTLIRLKDVAQVQQVDTPPPGITRVNGQPAVVLRINKRSDANTVAVVDAVQEALRQLHLPARGVQTFPVIDQSTLIRQSVRSLTWAGGIGALLSILSLFFFLWKRWREILLIALSIPVSVAATLLVMGWFGQSLNLMTLGGLALGMGMVVDNAIVVVENLSRLRRQGHSWREAAILGADQVTAAITASTLTTVAVFFPVLLLPGLASELLSSLGLTVTVALLASLLVATTLVPSAAASLFTRRHLPQARVFPRSATPTSRFPEPPALDGQWTDSAVPQVAATAEDSSLLGSGYSRLLSWALAHKAVTLAISLLLFAGSLLVIPRLGIELLPVPDASVLTVQATLPPGVSQARTLSLVERLEQEIRRHPEVAWVASQAGSQGTADVSSILAGGVNQAQLTVALRPGLPTTAASQLAQRLDAVLPHQVPADVQLATAVGGGFGSAGRWSDNSLHVDVRGSTLSQVQEEASQLAQRLRATGRFAAVRVDRAQDLPELRYTVSPARAAMAALIPGQVGLAVRQALANTTAFTLTLADGLSLPVVLHPRLVANGSGLDREALSQLEISSLLPSGAAGTAGMPVTPGSATLGRVATLTETSSPALLYRVNGQPTVGVTAVLGRTPQAQGASLIRQVLRQSPLPAGYSAQLVGTQQLIDETLSQLKTVLLLSIFLVWVVMAVQFESIGQSLLMLLAVPLGAAGALLALAVTKTALSLSSMMGLVVLGGIIVNNAIVLIDRINQLRRAGVELREAVRSGCRMRLRPVLMTAVTTVAGLVPLMIGPFSHDTLQSPLAISLSGGLLLGTGLTLLVIPVLYEMVAAHGTRQTTQRTAQGAAALSQTHE